MGFRDGSGVKNPLANTGDVGSILGSGRSPREGNGNPLQNSCLEDPMDRGAWQATIHGVTKNWTQLSNRHRVPDDQLKCLQVPLTACSYILPWDIGFAACSLGVVFPSRSSG